MTAGSRQRLSALVRYTICVVAVTWLVTHTQWAELTKVAASASQHWQLMAAGVLAFGPGPLLIAVRLRWVLAVNDVNLTTWQAIRVTFAGNFIINALPVGTYGGDAVKAYYIARDTPHKHEAVTSVFFDRVIGVAGLVGMSGVVVLLNWGNPAFAGWGRIIGVVVAAMLVGGSIYFSRRMRKLLRLDQIVARMVFGSHLQRIDRAVFAFRHRISRLIACFAVTAVLQAVAIVSMFLVGWSLGIVGDRPIATLPVYLAYTPICFLAGALPIGVMEETFHQLFVDGAGLGTREAAYSLSLMCRFIQLCWALPGIIVVFKAGRPQPLAHNLPDEPEPQLTTPP